MDLKKEKNFLIRGLLSIKLVGLWAGIDFDPALHF